MTKKNFFIISMLGISVASLLLANRRTWDCVTSLQYVDFRMNSSSFDIANGAVPQWDESKRDSQQKNRSISSNIDWEPSFLKWHASPVEVPKDWKFQTPKFCKNYKNQFDSTSATNRNNKIIVHYHLQHNAGTNFYILAKDHFTDECATRCCYQEWKHCMVSYNEEVEAENIRSNYQKHGVQYVSYELMLPPRFPMPFVSESAREGIYFTTIIRDPFKRFLTYMRRARSEFNGNAGNAGSPFWAEFSGRQKIYAAENLNTRWLSGAVDEITTEHVNIAKCRLQLFDLVIADTLYTQATKQILCPLNNWISGKHCSNDEKEVEHKSKSDKLEGTTPHFIGAWIERLRPSFEIYDYARLLSLKQLKQHGVKDLPEVSEVPSYLQTLARYTNMTVTDAHLQRIPRISLENEEIFHPPKEFCEHMKKVWTSNPDAVPNAYGIGTIKQHW
mmetsp:Transcript_79/g.157  ORF Transcript_79/g.157 Transcript_79/m.157 type:complete len:445 (-) Transcript_79:29-1363(-)